MSLDRTPAHTPLTRGSRKRPVAAALLRTSLSAVAILVSTPISALGTAPQCAPVADRFDDDRVHASLDLMLRVAAAWAGHQRQQRDIPGLGLVVGGSLHWAEGFGVTNLERGTPATPESVFRIASVSKTMTATAILKLRDDGKLHLDDTITDHLPWFELRGYEPASRPIRIFHLLTHSAGVPRDSALSDWNRMYHPPTGEAIAALPGQSLLHAPGAQYNYSNLAYGLLGMVVEAASGKSFDQYLDEEIFAPLGMTDSTAHPSPSDRHVASGYSRPSDGNRRVATFQALGVMTPAGGAASSVTDLAKYAAFHLGCAAEGGEPLLRAGTLEEMRSVHFPIDSTGRGAGYPWFVEEMDGETRISHSGGLPAQTSQLLLIPSEGLGVVALTNAEDGAPEELADQIMRLARVALDQVCGSPELSREQMERYLGRYTLPVWLDEEHWGVPVGGRLGIIPVRSDSPADGLICLSHVAESRFTITRGFGWREELTFERHGEDLRAIGPTFYLQRSGPLPTREEEN